MRIRSIKPEFWRSDDIAALPISARLLFIGLWSYVDDNGVGADTQTSIVADLFAHDLIADPADTLRRLNADLTHICEAGLITRYEVNSKRYLYITNWERHQLVRNPSKGNSYPLPPGNKPISPDPNVDPAQSLRRPSALEGEGEQGRGNRGAEEQGSGGSAPPPRQCRKHSHWVGDQNCRTCGSDRKAFEAWEAAEARKPKPAKSHEHSWMPDGTCLSCDEQQGGDF